MDAAPGFCSPCTWVDGPLLCVYSFPCILNETAVDWEQEMNAFLSKLSGTLPCPTRRRLVNGDLVGYIA